MPDEEKNEEEVEEQPSPEEAEPSSSKSSVKLLGGVVGLISLAGLLAFMAIPSKPGVKRFKGPFHHEIFETEISSNTTDNNLTRYLKLKPHCMYEAYDETYVTRRASDSLYFPMLKHVVGQVISSKTLDDAYTGTNREVFAEELRQVVEPVLFPVHFGETKFPLDTNEKTGLRPGNSYDKSTFRGRFHDHVLKLDAVAGTIQIDEGPKATFSGTEEDLLIWTDNDESLYVDVTSVKEDFIGEIQVGVYGRIRKVFVVDAIAQ